MVVVDCADLVLIIFSWKIFVGRGCDRGEFREEDDAFRAGFVLPFHN